MRTNLRILGFIPVLALAALSAPANGGASPLGTAFTYQGRLDFGGEPLNGSADFQFSLWDSLAGGAQIGAAQPVSNVIVSDGLFTAVIDFGSTSFNGSARWLEIAVCAPTGCGGFTTLSPRQRITVAPYALQTRGLFVNDALQVGVNTESPLSRFTVSGDVTLANDIDSIRFPDTDGVNSPMIQMFTNSTTNGNRMVLGHSPSFSTWGLQYIDSTDQFRFIGDSASALTIDLGSRNVGVRNNNPLLPLHVDGGTDAAPTGGGYFAVGDIGATNIVVDSNEIMARNNGAVAPLALNASGGNIHMLQFGGGNVGIGTSAPDATLHVAFGSDASLGGGGFILAGPPTGLNVVLDNNEIMARNNGVAAVLTLNAQGGTVATGGSLDVAGNLFVNSIDATGNIDAVGSVTGNFLMGRSTNVHAANIWRDGSDGPLIFFFNDGVDIGSISMSGQNVSYNAFTGSHFAWIDETDLESIEPGRLVRLTGVNHRHGNRDGGEIVYGVTPTSTANDPACLGTYLSVQESAKPAGLENPYLIAAAGNGEMWVADVGRGDIQPGDDLISSNVPGCAMKDDPETFAIGHIIARAAEAVEWSGVETDPKTGVRWAKISVLFGASTRGRDLSSIVAAQQNRIDSLESQLASLQALAARISRIEAAQAPTQLAREGGRQ